MEISLLNSNVNFVALLLFGFVGINIKSHISGSTHYCDPCHSGQNPNNNKPCRGPEYCPLGVGV